MPTYRPNGNAIKSMRVEKKLSQEAVAALSEELPPPYSRVSDRTLRTAERGKARISEEQLKAIAAVLETKLEDIIFPDPVLDPFRGLQAYRFEDSSLFGGRDAINSRAIQILHSHNVALIVGPSGSGKSSLCYAGVAPAFLTENEQYLFVSFRPGRSALDSLCNALCAKLYPSDSTVKTAEVLRDMRNLVENDEQALADILSAAQIQKKLSSLLIYIDQGEELYTQSSDSSLFIKQLDNAIARIAPNLKLLISARSDYAGDLTHLNGDFFKRFDYATIILRRMNDAELRDAIVRPLKQTEIPYDEYLIDALVNDARDQEGYLPHIQFVLSQLWNSDLNPRLRLKLERYFEIGRLSGAITRHASKIYNQLGEEDKERVKSALPRLVVSGTAGRNVEARRLLSSFTEKTQKVLHRLAASDARILAIDEDGYVSYAHEEIIRQWPELRKWLDSDTEDARLKESLERDIETWIASKESVDYLVPYGKKLGSYEALFQRLPTDAVPTRAAEFLSRSRQAVSLFRQPEVRIGLAAASIALSLIVIFLAYSIISSYLLEWRKKEAIEAVNTIAKSKKHEYIIDRKLYFPDWPIRRLALYGEIGNKFKTYYDFTNEAQKVHQLLDSCAPLDNTSLNHIAARAMSLKHYSEKCGYNSISGLTGNFSIFTSSELPENFALVNAKFTGSFLNRIDFKNTDLNAVHMPCSVLDGSNLSRVRNFLPSQISQSFCLFARTGPPVLPKGWQQPPGCRWINELKSKYKWQNYDQARYPATKEESLDILRRQTEVVEKFYYKCTSNEKAYETAENAFRLALNGTFDLAKQEALRAMKLNADSYVRLKTAPVFGLAGDLVQAEQNYNAIKGVFIPRWGNFEREAIADITALISKGYKSEYLLKTRRSMLVNIYSDTQ